LPGITLFEHQRISFRDLGWSIDHPYLDLLESLNESAGDTIIQVGRKSVKAAQYVGVIRVADLTIQILPKIDYENMGDPEAPPGSVPRMKAESSAMANLLHMLAYAEDLPIKEETTSSLGTSDVDWFELLTRFFATELHENILRGPYRSYIRREERLPVMRGKWLVSKQFNRHPFERHQFDVAYDEFDLDSPLNQVFRYVGEHLLRLTNDPDNRRLLLSIRAWLIDVSLKAHIEATTLEKIHFTRINERYRTAYNLAKLFLEREAMLLASGPQRLFAFVFDMNKLFERFVAGFLLKHQSQIFGFSEKRYVIKRQSKGELVHLLHKLPDETPTILLKPDILIQDSYGRNALVLDTKYKRLGNDRERPRISEPDLYQMMAYMTRFNCTRSLLLHPAESEFHSPQVTYRVQETPQTIDLAVINLHRPLRDPHPLIDEFRSILDFIALQAHRETYHGEAIRI